MYSIKFPDGEVVSTDNLKDLLKKSAPPPPTPPVPAKKLKLGVENNSKYYFL